MSENKVTFGLEKVHIAFVDDLGGYKSPVAVPGAVGFSPSPEGDQQKFYADNMAYFVTNANNGYTADLEVANIPDSIKAEMLGWKVDNNGMLVEIADAQPKKFALMGQVQGDKRNRRFVYYDVQANRPSKESKTKNESIEPNTDTLPVTISPVEKGGKIIVKGDLELNDTNATAYNGFFTAVYEPDFTVTP